jgi:DNA-binding MarR family transcriptional regulator
MRTERPDPLRADTAVVTPSGASDDAAAATSIDTIIADVQSAMCRIRAAGSRRLLEQGVSMAHMHVLWLLEHQGPLPMSRIAEAIDVSLSNATGLVDRMEERDLVERTRVPEDRRVVIVRPTERGRSVMDELELLRRGHMERILRHLSAEQLARVGAVLDDIRSAYAAERASAGTDPPGVDTSDDRPTATG